VRRVAAPERPVDVKNGKFPYCLVWVPLPIIAWLVPFVGHVGICRQDGVILDFAGVINIDNLAFGSTAKYVSLREDQVLSPNICCQSFVPILNSRASFKPRPLYYPSTPTKNRKFTLEADSWTNCRNSSLALNHVLHDFFSLSTHLITCLI